MTPQEYYLYKRILEEENTERHPNIDERSMNKWMESRREEIRETLRARKKEIEKKKEVTEEEAEEMKRIDDLLRERIVERRSTTLIPKNNEEELEIIICDAPEGIDMPYESIIDLFCGSSSLDVVMHAKKQVATGKIRELSEYVLNLALVNMNNKCSSIPHKMMVYVLALDFIMDIGADAFIPEKVVYALEQAAHLNCQRQHMTE